MLLGAAQLLPVIALLLACRASGSGAARDAVGSQRAPAGVLPGISVLLRDSMHLIAGKKLGLLTNQTGIDERGRSDIDILASDSAVKASGASLVVLFSPEHGIRGDEDRQFIASGRDTRSGLPLHSLYGATTLAPPDSVMRQIDVLIFDLQDIGTRTWTYVGNLVYALRSAQRNGKQLVVLDRPNPLNGLRRDGPMLDSSISNADEHRADKPARPYALFPFPLRHGMTMGEMALFYNSALGIGADLRVVPMRGWSRSMWFDQTGLPWVKPSPNLPDLVSATIYPALVAFEGSNMSVGRGTDDAFQHLGAPWLNAEATVKLLQTLNVPGVRFVAESFTPRSPGDGKYADTRIPAIHIRIEDRDRIHAGRLSAALLWAIDSISGDSLRLNDASFDLRLGSASARTSLRAGDDPDTVIDRSLPAVLDFQRRVSRFFLYR
jgi:uncharacterized protein YbbC (DUF1343 family)